MTDSPTNRWTDRAGCKVACTRLKSVSWNIPRRIKRYPLFRSIKIADHFDMGARGDRVVSALTFGFGGRGINSRLHSQLRRSIASVACVNDWNKAPLMVEADNDLTRHWQESYTKRSNDMAQCGELHGLSENQMPHSCSSRPGRLPRLTTKTTAAAKYLVL